MDYGVASYFDGYHFQHIVEYYEVKRLAAIDAREEAHFRRMFAKQLRQRRMGDIK